LLGYVGLISNLLANCEEAKLVHTLCPVHRRSCWVVWVFCRTCWLTVKRPSLFTETEEKGVDTVRCVRYNCSHQLSCSQAQLLGCVGLFSNLLANCEEAKLACVSLQLPLLLQQLWALSRSMPTMRRALLPLLCNYVAHCAPAKVHLMIYIGTQSLSFPIYIHAALVSPARCPPCGGRFCPCSATTLPIVHRQRYI